MSMTRTTIGWRQAVRPQRAPFFTSRHGSRRAKTPSPSCSAKEAATIAEGGAEVARAAAAPPPAGGGAKPSPALATKCMNVFRVRGSRAPDPCSPLLPPPPLTPVPGPCPVSCCTGFPPCEKSPGGKPVVQAEDDKHNKFKWERDRVVPYHADLRFEFFRCQTDENKTHHTGF